MFEKINAKVYDEQSIKILNYKIISCIGGIVLSIAALQNYF